MTMGDLTVSCECAPFYDTEYEGSSERTPTRAVVDAVAEAAGVDGVDLSPLYDAIDPDGLDRLFDHSTGDGTVLAFSIDGWNVFVRGDGRIRVCDATQSVASASVFARPKE